MNNGDRYFSCVIRAYFCSNRLAYVGSGVLEKRKRGLVVGLCLLGLSVVSVVFVEKRAQGWHGKNGQAR